MRIRLFLAALAVCWTGPAPARAVGADGEFAAACIMAAADAHRLPPVMLVILLRVEGGRLGEISRNRNGTADIGPMQVNDIWLPKLAAHWRSSRDAAALALRDEFCANVEGGAWILRQALDEAHGDLWEAAGLYHSHNEDRKTEYFRAVLAQAGKLHREVLAAGDRAPGQGDAR